MCLVSLGLPAWAQSEIGSATIDGTVMDPTGRAIQAAKVTVTNPETGLTRSSITNEAGLYSFPRLPVGGYDLAIEAPGFKSYRRSGIAVGVGSVATLNVNLEIGATQETVTVTAEAPVVESTRSQTSTTVTTEQVGNLPINGRNFLDFTVLTPGVVRDPTRTGDLSFGGQRGTENSLLVDGSDANNVFFGQSTGRAGTGRNPYSFSQDAVQEFQVSANSYAAEVGRAGGGIINVITKSGTNTLHGTGFEFFRDKALNANSWENNRRDLPKRAYHFNQFGGNLGGPIVKNKAFFFFDYDGQRNTTPNTVFLQVAPPSDPLSQQGAQLLQPYLKSYGNSLNNDVYLGKVDWNLTGSQRLSVRFNANRFTGLNFENNGFNSAEEHTGNSNVTTDNVAVDHTLVLGANSVLESRYAFTRDNEPGTANSAAPEAFINQNGARVMAIGRNDFSPRYTNLRTSQIVESLSLVAGRHALKFGGDLDFQTIGNYFPGNFSGSYTFNSYADFAARRAASFTQAFAGAGTAGPLSNPNVQEYAFYAEDSQRATERLTLNYGLRYDLFRYAQPPVKNPDPGLAALGLDTSRIPRDNNNLGPRFGFAYRVTRSDRVVLRGGYGIYYGRTPTILTGTAFTQNGIQVQTFTLNTSTGGIPTYPDVLSAPPALSRTPDIFVFPPDYVQPVTHQWSFNVESRLARDTALTVGYLGVRGEHLTRTRDINLLPAVPLAGSLPDGAPVIFYRHPGRPNPHFGRISLFDSGADSIYHGGFVQLSKRFAGGFQLQTSYTFSKVLDDAPDQTSVVVGVDDPKDAQDTLQPNLDRGRGNADIRQRFVFAGIWDINYARHAANPFVRALLSGYQLSLISQVQSGRPFTESVGGFSDINNDGNFRTDRPPGVGRNTIDGPGFATLDARFTRDFGLREHATLRLMFEGFNVTNRANFSSILTSPYNFNATTRVFSAAPGYLSPTATYDPRILQLAAKVMF